MGMDYMYAGSASYPRFDEELTAVAKLFGGEPTEHLKEKIDTEPKTICDYFFGTLSSMELDDKKFVFPENTNPVLVKWFNNPYGDFNFEETKIIWDILKYKHDEIEKVSSQIWQELKYCRESGIPWHIC